MSQSYETNGPRRQFIVLGISMVGSVLGFGSVSLLSGCGDDKGDVTHPENPTDVSEKAKDSMQYYQNARLKKGAPKKQ
jgi:hypothetical protein